MKTNLIQNYILNQNGLASSKETPKKPMPEFNIKDELDNRTFIKPLPGNGKLVKNNIFYAPVSMVKGFAYDIKSLRHASKGNANDHELGKINDVAMKLGGLAIASYLFTRKQTPKTKAMEFVGLSSFFASMVLWKKIGIQLPAKLIHGVNVDQQYEDSFGRKKPFYLDPQFLPWDLYKDKEINKIGDRLGVPKDIPNRREFIQEKMKKIAVQNNTLWMLTAGFATPVMSALICNAVDKPLTNFLVKQRNKNADKLLENFSSNVSNFRDDTSTAKLNNILELNGDKPITKKVFNELIQAITEGVDLVTANAIKKDLKGKIFGDNYLIDESVSKQISDNMKKELKKKYSEEIIEIITPSETQINSIFKKRNLVNTEAKPTDFQKIMQYISLDIEDNIKAYNEANPDSKINIKTVKQLLLAQSDDINPIVKGLKSSPTARLTSTVQAGLRNLANIMTDFKAKISVLDKYAYLKTGAAEDTVIAKYYNDFVQDLTKIFKFTPKEIESVRLDRELMAELLQSKIERVCADPNEYKRVTKEVVQRMAHFQTLIKPADISGKYNTQVNNVFNDVTSKLLSLKEMDETINALIGKEVTENGNTYRKASGSLKNIQIRYIQDRIDNTKNSFNWFLGMLDLNKRISTLINVDALHGGLRREVKEEMVALCKLMMLQGHAADFATKFFALRNPFPERDFSQIEIKDGKVNYKYLGHTGNTRVDIPQNAQFFDESMKLMFDNKMHPDTIKILDEHTMVEQLNSYRKNVLECIGQDSYFAKPRHLAWGKITPSSSDKRFSLLGATPDEMMSKISKQMFNSKKWLKMFGTFGAGLIGASVIAQFFFGRMKTPAKIQQKGNE